MYDVASDMQKINDGFRCSKFGVPTWSALFYRLNALPRVLGGWLPRLPYPLRALSICIPIPPACCIPLLVALANEVVLQRLNGLCGVSCLLGLAVVCDQDGLLRRGDGNAGSALDVVVAQVSALLALFPACGGSEGREISYLAGVDVAVVNAGDDKSLAGDVDALSVCLVNSGGLALGDVGEVLHLLGADLFAIPCQLAEATPRADCWDRCEVVSSLGGGRNMASFLEMAG